MRVLRIYIVIYLMFSNFSVEVEVIHSCDCLGRISSDDIRSSISVPEYPVSTRDGIAFRIRDIDFTRENHFKIIGENFAGEESFRFSNVLPISSNLSENINYLNSIFIATGAFIAYENYQFDCVLEIEKFEKFVDITKSELQFKLPSKEISSLKTLRPLTHEVNIRPAASDIKIGDILVTKGERFGPVEIGLLAMANIQKVKVLPRIKIGILSTGDEILNLGEVKTKTCSVYDCNRPLLMNYLKDSDFRNDIEVHDFGIFPDRKLQEKLSIDKPFFSEQLMDFVISTGGVSVGQRDFLKEIIEKVEVGKIFDYLNIKPGKPCHLSICKQMNKPFVFLGLPGNPVSVGVGFHLVVRTIIRVMQKPLFRPFKAIVISDMIYELKTNELGSSLFPVKCVTRNEIKLDRLRPEFHRAKFVETFDSGLYQTESVKSSNNSSSNLFSLKNACVLLQLPPGEALEAGSIVDGLKLDSNTILRRCGVGKLSSFTEWSPRKVTPEQGKTESGFGSPVQLLHNSDKFEAIKIADLFFLSKYSDHLFVVSEVDNDFGLGQYLREKSSDFALQVSTVRANSGRFQFYVRCSDRVFENVWNLLSAIAQEVTLKLPYNLS